jgi:DNA-directed RNA polymerase specialized sigma24 family protein
MTIAACSPSHTITNRITRIGSVDDEEIEKLVEAAAAQDEAAWQSLWEAVNPQLLKIVAQPRFLGRLGQVEDDRHNIVLQVMARLRMYLDARAQNPRLKFMSWLRVVAKRVGIDYLRAHPDYVRRHDAGASEPGRWVDAGTLPPSSQLKGDRPPVTNAGTAHELLQFAKGAVPEDQVRALEMWLQSESFEDIARTLGLASPQVAEKTVRATIERLRRRFRDANGDPTT